MQNEDRVELYFAINSSLTKPYYFDETDSIGKFYFKI